MTHEELAARINGREYRSELSSDLERLAKNAGLVVVFGASDDLMEFRGAIHEEIGAWDGETAYIFKKRGLWDIMNESDFNEYRDKLEDVGLLGQLKYSTINAIWCPTENGEITMSWKIEAADIPHSTFQIIDDGETYCEGIVFHIDSLEN